MSWLVAGTVSRGKRSLVAVQPLVRPVEVEVSGAYWQSLHSIEGSSAHVGDLGYVEKLLHATEPDS